MSFGAIAGRRRRRGDTGPPVFSTLVVDDSFDRANSALTLGDADTAQTWTAEAGTWGINTNLAYCATPAFGGIASIDASAADCDVRVTHATRAHGVGLVVRFLNTTNYFRLTDQTTHYLLQRVEGGAAMDMGESAGVTPTSGDVLRVVVAGSHLWCLVNDVVVIQASSDFNDTETLHGMFSDNNGDVRFNTFQVRT